jgi:polar amino acid transport system substrate-binding protein
MKNFIKVAVLVGAAFLIFGCASGRQEFKGDPTVLRVGINPTVPPMAYKQGKEIMGVEVELARALGRELNREVVFVELKWPELLDALDEDRADILMSAITITTARSFRVTFTNPYMKVGQMALVRNQDKYNFQVNLANTAKRGVGVKPGTTAEQLIRQEYPRAKVKYYDSGERAAAALLDQKLDLFVSDSPMIWYLSSRYESQGLTVAPLIFTQDYLGWAVRRNDEALHTAVNAYLARAQKDGDLQRILQRWMPGYR